MIGSSSVVRAVPSSGSSSSSADAACIDLWVAAVAARDGVAESPAVRARAADKFAAPRVALVVAGASGDDVDGFVLVTAPGTGLPGDDPEAAYLSLLAVRPGVQGAGLGRTLLAAAVEAARAAGYERCLLHALDDNAPALRLYRAAGFAPAGEAFPHALSGRPTRAWVAG